MKDILSELEAWKKEILLKYGKSSSDYKRLDEILSRAKERAKANSSVGKEAIEAIDNSTVVAGEPLMPQKKAPTSQDGLREAISKCPVHNKAIDTLGADNPDSYTCPEERKGRIKCLITEAFLRHPIPQEAQEGKSELVSFIVGSGEININDFPVGRYVFDMRGPERATDGNRAYVFRHPVPVSTPEADKAQANSQFPLRERIGEYIDELVSNGKYKSYASDVISDLTKILEETGRTKCYPPLRGTGKEELLAVDSIGCCPKCGVLLKDMSHESLAELADRKGFAGILCDPPYSIEDCKHYRVGETAYPKPNEIIKRCFEVLPVGGKVGIIHYILPGLPKNGRFVAAVGVMCGFNNRIRVFSVFEKIE